MASFIELVSTFDFAFVCLFLHCLGWQTKGILYPLTVSRIQGSVVIIAQFK